MDQSLLCGLIDLHLHLDGSLSLSTARKLAAMQGIDLPGEDAAVLKKLTISDGCRDLNEYLEKFDFPCSLLQTRESIEEAVVLLTEELSDLGVAYAEIRFAPQKHCERGLTQNEVVAAAVRGLARSPIPANLILCCMRGNDNAEENRETVRLCAQYAGQGVCAVDLAGAEALFPTGDFAELFSLARSLGVRSTIHAGEADGAESVRAALSFGAERIGHGVRSAEDSALVRELAERNIPLEVCPTSNRDTGVFTRWEDYPFHELLSAGVRVTVNSDDMSVSATDVRREYEKVIEAYALTDKEVKTLRRNAVYAAFCDDTVRAALLKAEDALG